eukprot:GFUD01031994.1.p1 GENE.GFUD01031994.1~~GFUD01031994.1.p1  ORF type:complete len:628 (+),score=140.69 GFUD01031994.1:146-2029(+)
MLAILILMFHSCNSRLSIVSSSDTHSLAKSGEDTTLWCETNTPWFLCVWRGPDSLAITKTLGQATGDCVESPDPRISLTGSRNTCRLSIYGVRTTDAGDYSCVLSDKEDVQTATRNTNLEVGVVTQVKWMQGSSVQYSQGEKVNLTCQSEGGHPRPSLIIRTRENVQLNEKPAVYEGALVSRSVSIDGAKEQNITMLYCQAEQRGRNGALLYHSYATIRLEVLSTLMLNQWECSVWWCGWSMIVFIFLLIFSFLLAACCGIYFCFCTRGKHSNLSEHNSIETQIYKQPLITQNGIPEPVFVAQPATAPMIDSIPTLTKEAENNTSFNPVQITHLQGEISCLSGELNAMTNAFTAEQSRSLDLGRRLATMENELRFKLEVQRCELVRGRGETSIIDISSMDNRMDRLKDELTILRRTYNEDLRVSEETLERTYKKRITDLEARLGVLITKVNSAEDVSEVQIDIDQYKRKIEELDSNNRDILTDMSMQWDKLAVEVRKRETLSAKMASKEIEMTHLAKQNEEYKTRYEEMRGRQMCEDSEVRLYNKLIVPEVARISSRYSKQFTQETCGRSRKTKEAVQISSSTAEIVTKEPYMDIPMEDLNIEENKEQITNGNINPEENSAKGIQHP